MLKRVAIFFAVLASLSFSCRKTDPVVESPSGESPSPGEYVLPLVETTDMHGYIVHADNLGLHYRLAYIADKVEDIRARKEDGLLLLDGGDLYQGASVSNLMSGWPVYVSMHKMGYDAVAVGNHEFDWGIESLVDADATLPDYEWEGRSFVNEVPVVCANLYRDGVRVPFTRDYVIVEKSALNAAGETVPVRIGIIGFVVDYAGSIMSTQFTGKGYSINADFSIAGALAEELESSGQCDATLLLIHGAAGDAAGYLGPRSCIDLVLGGHSHAHMCGKTGWGLPYLQGGRYCENYGYAELKFQVDDTGKVSFKGVDNLMTPPVDASLDGRREAGGHQDDLSAEIVAVSDYALDYTAQAQNDVIGHIRVGATNYYLDGSDGRASVMSNWMCDILRRIGEADVAFVNGGGIRTSFPLGGRSARDITVANVYEMFPFSNTTYVYRLTYAELLQVFEYAMTSGGASLFSCMTGLDCRFSQTEHGTYKTYEVYSLSKDGTVIYRNGKWTGDWALKTVTLSVSEFLATNERTDYYTGIANPLVGWNKTSRLLRSDLVDNENAVRVLRAEAASSGGLLSIDTAPHFILVP